MASIRRRYYRSHLVGLERGMTWRDRLANLYNDIADEFNARQEQIAARYPRPLPPMPIGVQIPSNTGQMTDASLGSQPQVTGDVDTFVNVTLNGSGNGTASIGPQRVREWWSNLVVAVSVATTVNEAQCSLYVGSTIQSSTFLGTTPNGSHGATATLPRPIPTGYQIWCVWSGGDANAQATLHVTGTYTIGKPR